MKKQDSLKKAFLSIKTYEEFDRRREEFKEMKMDNEILLHGSKIFGEVSNTDEELFKEPPDKAKRGQYGKR